MLRTVRKGLLRRYIRMSALRKGIFGGSRPWLVVFLMLRMGGLIGKITKRGEMPLALSEPLKRGQTMIIEHKRAPTRRERKAAQRRADSRAARRRAAKG